VFKLRDKTASPHKVVALNFPREPAIRSEKKQIAENAKPGFAKVRKKP
jgi:hypothetical protein